MTQIYFSHAHGARVVRTVGRVKTFKVFAASLVYVLLQLKSKLTSKRVSRPNEITEWSPRIHLCNAREEAQTCKNTPLDHLHFLSHPWLSKSTFPPYPTQSISFSPSFPLSFLSSTEHTRPPLCLRVNNVHYLRHCPTLQNRGKAVVGSLIPRRASNPCLWKRRLAKYMEVGSSKWPLSQ